MGGMAAQIPVKNNPKAQDEAMAKVKDDKVRSFRDTLELYMIGSISYHVMTCVA